MVELWSQKLPLDLLEACDATHCHTLSVLSLHSLTIFNPDDSVHIEANLQLILQAGSYQTLSHSFLRCQHITHNAFLSCIVIIILSENQPRIPNIFILITLSSISTYIHSYGADGFVRKWSCNYQQFSWNNRNKIFHSRKGTKRSSDNNCNICSTVSQI